MLLSATAACSRGVEPEVRSISVQGVAEIQIPADRVILEVAVIMRDMDARKVQKQNDEKVRQVLAFLKSLSIPSSDISTGYINLERKEVELRDKPPVFLGYEASSFLTIILKEIGKYDQLIAGIMESGVNHIESIRFESTKERETRKMARINAIRAARQKAEYLTNELQQRVGEPLTINVDEIIHDIRSNDLQIPQQADDQEIVALAPDNIVIRAEVKVTFKLHKR